MIYLVKKAAFKRGGFLLKIREAVLSDSQGLAHIVGEFNYPASSKSMRKRMEKITTDPSYLTLIAERNGSIIGLLGMHMEYSYVSDENTGRIIAMVVHSDERNQGIGRKLLQEAETWALEKEISVIVLNSGNREERRIAHMFYEKNGYKAKSTGFYKSLSEPEEQK